MPLSHSIETNYRKSNARGLVEAIIQNVTGKQKENDVEVLRLVIISLPEL